MTSAILSLAEAAVDDENYDRALKLLKPLLRRPTKDVYDQLGFVYQMVAEDDADLQKAIHYYRLAAKLGHGHAAQSLGVLYTVGGPGIRSTFLGGHYDRVYDMASKHHAFL